MQDPVAETIMTSIPASWGRLAAVEGGRFIFEATDGTIRLQVFHVDEKGTIHQQVAVYPRD